MKLRTAITPLLPAIALISLFPSGLLQASETNLMHQVENEYRALQAKEKKILQALEWQREAIETFEPQQVAQELIPQPERQLARASLGTRGIDHILGTDSLDHEMEEPAYVPAQGSSLSEVVKANGTQITQLEVQFQGIEKRVARVEADSRASMNELYDISTRSVIVLGAMDNLDENARPAVTVEAQPIVSDYSRYNIEQPRRSERPVDVNFGGKIVSKNEPIAIIAADKASLFTGPAEDEDLITMVPQGHKVGIETREGDWYRVVNQNGIRGWLHTTNLRFGATYRSAPNQYVSLKGYDSSSDL